MGSAPFLVCASNRTGGGAGRSAGFDCQAVSAVTTVTVRAAAIATGVFRKLAPDLAMQVLWGAVHGVVALVLTAEGFPFAARTKLVDAAIDNAIRGMTDPTKNRRATS